MRLILVSNYHHQIKSEYGEIIVVDDLEQAADIMITNICSPNDIVITQDYGLASIVLARGADAIHPRGAIYDKDKMDVLLMERFIKHKARQSGIRIKGTAKRHENDDVRFKNNLLFLIKKRLDTI